MMADLVRLLREGGYSCVLQKDGEVRTFRRRGVIDLYTLLVEDPGYMRDALLADKVIGKGAAAVVATAGVKEVYAEVISLPAVNLLRQAGISVSWGERVSAIRNRAGDGWCPLETACREASTAEEAMPVVDGFVKRMFPGLAIKVNV